MKAPQCHFTQDTYTFRWADEHIAVELDGVREARGGELRAMLTVTTTRNGGDRPQLLHQSDFNLSGPRARSDVVRALSQRLPVEEFDWSGAIEVVCYKARERWQEGDPLIYLPDYQPPTGERFLLSPFIEFGGPTVIFARGGTGKSLFGLALALTVGAGVNAVCGLPSEQRRVAYLDWETEPATHHERLKALCRGCGVPFEEAGVWYRKQTASLAESAMHLRRVFVREGIGLVVIDSLGMARGGEPESADTTIRLFAAARSLDVPVLCIDHITKNGGADQTSPFGSVYTENAARSLWRLERVEDNAAGLLTVALVNTKGNNHGKLGRRAYDVTFRESADGHLESVIYDERDAREVASFFSRLSQPEQIAEILRRNNRAMTPAEIAERMAEFDVVIKSDQIRAVMHTHPKTFVQVGKAQPGYPQHWGLLASEVA